MIADPDRRGRSLGAFFLRLEPSLWVDVVASGLLPAGDEPRARREWACFALHACVRGLVAAGGFDSGNGQAVDALHDVVALAWASGPGADAGERRALLGQRYDEYGELTRVHAARGDEAVLAVLGSTAARRLAGTDIAPAELGAMLAELYDAVAHGCAETVREAEA